MYKIPKSVRCNNREKLYGKKKKTHTHTHKRQYLHDSTIYLCPQNCRDFTILMEKYRV